MKLPAFLSLRRITPAELVLDALGIYWIFMVPSLLGHRDASFAATRFLLLPAIAFMFWLTARKIHEIDRATAVLGQLRAPSPLWRDLSGGALRHVALVWLFLATGCSLQLALPASGVSAASGAALMSLVGTLALLRSLPQVKLHADLALLCAGLPLMLYAPGALFDWFGNLPATLLWMLALVFPAALLALAQHWKKAAPGFRWQPPAPIHPVASFLRAQIRRCSVLLWNASEAPAREPLAILGRMVITVTPAAMLLMSMTPGQAPGKVYLIRCAALILMAVMLAGALVVRDLHWRSLLAPGGMPRNRIGNQVWLSTMSVLAVFCCAAGVAAVLAMRFGFDQPWTAIAATLQRYGPLPLELACATALAVALRPLPHAGFWGVATVLLAFSGAYKLGVGVTVSLPVYLAALSAATMLLVALANHLWTLRKLEAAAGLRL